MNPTDAYAVLKVGLGGNTTVAMVFELEKEAKEYKKLRQEQENDRYFWYDIQPVQYKPKEIW